MKMKAKYSLSVMLVSVILCNATTCADQPPWQLIDLIDQSDIVAIVKVDQLHEVDASLLHVDLSVNKILKGIDEEISTLTLRHPYQKKGVWLENKPITFIKRARYLVFLKCEKPDFRMQSLRLVSPTSGAVRLEGDKTYRNPALLDSYPPQYRRFNEHQLLQRIRELMVEGPCWPPAPDRAKQLQEKGYPTNTLEQVIKAIKSKDTVVRCIALGLYAQRANEEEAITHLKEALNDSKVEIRWHAAHWLGRLGSKDGLEQLQQDFKKLTARYTDLKLSEDNTVKEPTMVKKHEEPPKHNLEEALNVARVLAELGDQQGYRLAARTALEGTLPEQRYLAVTVLVEMVKTDKTFLEAEDFEPVSVLCTVVKCERDVEVFYKLVNLVAELWKRKNIDDAIAIQILEMAKDSTNQSEGNIRIARLFFDLIKSKMKTIESKN